MCDVIYHNTTDLDRKCQTSGIVAHFILKTDANGKVQKTFRRELSMLILYINMHV